MAPAPHLQIFLPISNSYQSWSSYHNKTQQVTVRGNENHTCEALTTDTLRSDFDVIMVSPSHIS